MVTEEVNTGSQSQSVESSVGERDWIDENLFDDSEVMLDRLADFMVQQLNHAGSFLKKTIGYGRFQG